MKRETRRVAAQFLNGLAIAVLAAGAIAPAASGSISPTVASASVFAGVALHGLAMLLVWERRR